jgi:hypothetical protein
MTNWWQALFFSIAAILIIIQVIHGWRLGVARQVLRLIALVFAYTVVRWKPGIIAPFLQLLGIPELMAGVASALTIGLVIYGSINGLSAILLKRTSHQSVAPLRVAYGLGGAAIGLVFGLFLTWIALIGVRVLGTVAETEVLATSPEVRNVSLDERERRREVSGLVRGLASLKRSMDQGQTGAVAAAIDPLPSKVYTTLTRVALLISDEESIDRFLSYPGAEMITSHPRMVALTSDAEITELLNRGDYFGLLRNRNILAAANDPELAELVVRFKLDEALEHALSGRKEDSASDSKRGPTTRD